MQNIPLTYLATVQLEEVYIQQTNDLIEAFLNQPTDNQGPPEQSDDSPLTLCALDEAPVSKPGHLGYKGWKSGSIL